MTVQFIEKESELTVLTWTEINFLPRIGEKICLPEQGGIFKIIDIYWINDGWIECWVNKNDE